MQRWNVKCMAVVIALCPQTIFSLGAYASEKESCQGQLYRAKKDNVPIFDEASTTGQVLFQLMLGERVCYVGERDKFAVLDLESSPATKMHSGEPQTARPSSRLAYARLVDLWPPR